MDDNNLRFAFSRVKEDILFLTNELTSLKYEISQIKSTLDSFYSYIKDLKVPTDRQTNQQIYPTDTNKPTDRQTVPQEIEGLKSQNITISTGNEGVPTDRQTNQQTDQQSKPTKENIEENLKKASQILDSLDYLKKEIRQKFKRLTPQEMTVFSFIYQLSELDPQNTTYKQIANNLKLSESSIRDYVLKIIDKGIPLKKLKIDNKKVILSVSNDLKKVATLTTIIQLREL